MLGSNMIWPHNWDEFSFAWLVRKWLEYHTEAISIKCCKWGRRWLEGSNNKSKQNL
jgi:hypothetical protein